MRLRKLMGEQISLEKEQLTMNICPTKTRVSDLKQDIFGLEFNGEVEGDIFDSSFETAEDCAACCCHFCVFVKDLNWLKGECLSIKREGGGQYL